MNILGITSRVPYPPTDGARICMYQAVRSLAGRGHTVHLVAVEDEEIDTSPLQPLCQLHQVRFTPLPTAIGAGLTLFNERPYTVWKKDLDRVYPLLDSLQAKHRFDAMYVDQAHVAQYGAYMKSRYGLPYFLRSHNVEHEIYRRHLSRVTNPLMRRYLVLQCAAGNASRLPKPAAPTPARQSPSGTLRRYAPSPPGFRCGRYQQRWIFPHFHSARLPSANLIP